ncbi:MAG: ATP synthase F1 subunit gamma [Endomicrobium sp.]|jgi:F-type H+-transporting ATPase subunit gamma|nr:ATP synthase F1 subunit gamma [Endomicrobium sp.]
MVQNLQQIKKRIKTSNNIEQISKAIEMISASKILKIQSFVERYNPYAKKIKYMVQRVITEKKIIDKKENVNNKFVYIISPDKGLCGGLVMNLLKIMSSYVQQNDYVVTIGKKAASNVSKYDYNVIASFKMGINFPQYDDIYPMISIANDFYILGKVEKISIIYTEFKNIFVQEAVVNEILPIIPNQAFKNHTISYIFEPDVKYILKELLPYYFEVEFYDALMNAYASEQTARMIAMRNAKNNANDISNLLLSIYNKSRQEKITNEILDLANGK